MPPQESPTAEKPRVNAAEWVASRRALAEWLHAQSGAARWHVSRESFSAALARSAAYRFGSDSPTAEEVEKYLRGLHLKDLALACGLIEGCDAAWEHFIAGFRSVLYGAAAAITGCAGEAARELADSLYADLYGLNARGAQRESLFRYYHGRSKLATWLRAVLAQRHVDAARAAQRFEPLKEQRDEEAAHAPDGPSATFPGDPHRQRYLKLLSDALDRALAALDAKDRERLSLYYLEGWTLAQIGRHLGEHEATASRQLERIRRELRSDVEAILRVRRRLVDGTSTDQGLDDAQIELCFEYALEDWPFDLREALGKPAHRGRRRSGPHEARLQERPMDPF
jgi:RNA polymerase sigma-70 factor (ECF subfamily)